MRNTGIEFPEQGQSCLFDLGDPPAPGPAQMLIETLFSGITNGTERHGLMSEHGMGRWPGRHGYQHVARVVSTGDDVSAFQVGDVVFYGDYVGHRGWHVVDTDKPGLLCVKLPAESNTFALLGVAGVAMRAARRCRIGPSQRVWVAGCGLIGQFAAQSARALGAHVTVSDVNARRLDIARALGAHQIIDASGGYDELQKAGPYERIIDACGIPNLFKDIYDNRLLARGGVIGAIAARTEFTAPWSLLHMREASIEVSCHFSADDLLALIHLIDTGVIRMEPLILNAELIDDAPAIYETMRDRPGDLLGVTFDWSS